MLKSDDEGLFSKKSLLGRLLKSRTVLVAGVVTDKMAQEISAQLLILQDDDSKAPITVYVNSPGGSADSGFAIYDVMRFVKAPLRTICTGLCASAAILIYLATKKPDRYSLPHSRFLIHQPSTALYGYAADIKIEAEEIIRLKERYFSIIADDTGKPVEQITKDADRNFWLSAPQALEYGLVGKIVTSSAEIS